MPNIGKIADKIFALKVNKAQHSARIREIDKLLEIQELKLIKECELVGTNIVRTNTVTATIVDTELPDPVNWDDFYEYVINNNAPFLLHKRLTLAAIQEIWSRGETIPGIDKLNVSKVKTRKI